MSTNETQNRSSIGKKSRVAFGAFMVIVYLTVGVLCILEIFSFDNHSISIALGVLLVAYGIWRAYRLAKGMP